MPRSRVDGGRDRCFGRCLQYIAWQFDRSVSLLAWGYNEEALVAGFLDRAIDLLNRTVDTGRSFSSTMGVLTEREPSQMNARVASRACASCTMRGI
jgi:hypothetical protein